MCKDRTREAAKLGQTNRNIKDQKKKKKIIITNYQ
jgi:hypothetical protein